jgi:hypothetical protein
LLPWSTTSSIVGSCAMGAANYALWQRGCNVYLGMAGLVPGMHGFDVVHVARDGWPEQVRP